ncbi:MAG: hypothetical protein ACRCX8_15775 [Sarcina sp.]
MMYLSQATSEALDELTGAFFDLNRSFDRAVSIMTNKWCMPNASDIVHHKLAHLFPLMADDITAIKDRYNLSSVYPETHRDDRDYTDLADMFETLLGEYGEVYEMIKMVNSLAHTHGDLNVHADLVKVTQDYNVVMEQVITLRDKAVQMPTCYDTFDRHISSWKIDGLG